MDYLTRLPIARASGGFEATDTNRNPTLQMLTWLLLALTALMLGFRLLSRFFIKTGQPVGWEDVLITSAFLFNVGESIPVLVPQGQALGQDRAELSDQAFRDAIKVTYAQDILFLFSLGFGKLAVCAHLLQLSPGRTHRMATRALAGFISVWIVASVFASALQCGSKKPWNSDTGSCFNQKGFLIATAAFNIATDAALIILPVFIISQLQMALGLRVKIISFYSARVVIIVATAFQINYIHLLFEENFTLEAFPYYVTVQFILLASISSACIIYFWPLIRSLQSGMMLNNDNNFATGYTLSKLTKQKSSKFQNSTIGMIDDPARSRRDYIEIRTDLSLHESRNQEPASRAEVYNLAWENQAKDGPKSTKA